MRWLLAVIVGINLWACRTTRGEDERYFAGRTNSKDVVAGSKAEPYPTEPGRGEPLPSPFSSAEPIEEGAFHVLCAAQAQLPAPQALTIKALLLAVHQQNCADGETWLRDQRNKSLMIDSEELVELQTLAVLQNYPHIADVYIKTAKGIAPSCPLGKLQTCHFIKPDFE